jgi:hypothetical protein
MRSLGALPPLPPAHRPRTRSSATSQPDWGPAVEPAGAAVCGIERRKHFRVAGEWPVRLSVGHELVIEATAIDISLGPLGPRSRPDCTRRCRRLGVARLHRGSATRRPRHGSLLRRMPPSGEAEAAGLRIPSSGGANESTCGWQRARGGPRQRHRGAGRRHRRDGNRPDACARPAARSRALRAERAAARIRTADPFITSEVLCQLSYGGAARKDSPAPVRRGPRLRSAA